jgi:hypothetical protein
VRSQVLVAPTLRPAVIPAKAGIHFDVIVGNSEGKNGFRLAPE